MGKRKDATELVYFVSLLGQGGGTFLGGVFGVGAEMRSDVRRMAGQLTIRA